MSPSIRPDAVCDGGDLDCGSGLLLIIRDAMSPLPAGGVLEVESALEGSVLPFEERRRLLSLAQRFGIRAFDANLIVALVQDRARRGEPVETAAATIAMVPVATGANQRLGQVFAAAIAVAMLFDLALIAWLIVG